VLPTVHYNMGGVPTNYHGEVVKPKVGGCRGVRGEGVRCCLIPGCPGGRMEEMPKYASQVA
jgi:succinate dehydrogenase/fumarate reductase flavoprotein subunit